MLLIIIILAVVQGFCEFLPVSSSGHIVLLHNIFNLECDIVSLNIILHLATAISVIVMYRKQLWWLIKNPFSKQAINLLISTVVTIAFILIFKPLIDDLLGGKLLGISFLITAVVLLIATIINKKYASVSPVTTKTAIVMGLFQGLAVPPGISRSGITLCSGLVCGAEKGAVADFSFLMSLPIIIAGAIYDFIFEKPNFAGIMWWELLIGFIVAFLCGIIAIKATKALAQKTKLWVFSIYLAILSVMCFIIL